jgi:hypothetical protein
MRHWLVSALLLSAWPACQAGQPSGIARVAWLQGCWETSAPGPLVEEQWTAPRGKSMLSMGRTLRGEAMVAHEFVVLREQGGQLAYEAHPSGQAPATFVSKEITATQVVFENLEHDFPQRVGYQLKDAGTLLACPGA